MFGNGAKLPLLSAEEMFKKTGKRAFAAVIYSVRLAPRGFSNPLFLDFDADPQDGYKCNTMSLNLTNSRELARLIDDEASNWIGWGVKFRIVDKQIRQTREAVMGFEIVGVISPDEVKKRKTKPLPKSELEQRIAAATGRAQVNDDNAPEWVL